jgi:hypothetical protein
MRKRKQARQLNFLTGFLALALLSLSLHSSALKKVSRVSSAGRASGLQITAYLLQSLDMS